MEKYCTIAIFFGVGLSVLVRGLIFLESDAPLNIDTNDKDAQVTPVFKNRYDYRDSPLEDLANADGHALLKSNSLNIDEKSKDDNEEISPVYKNRDDYHDYPLENNNNVGSHALIRSASMNIVETSDGNDGEFEQGFQNPDDYHDYPLENRISADSHALIRSASMNTEVKLDDNGGENRDFENRNVYPLENLISGSPEMIESDPVLEKIPEDIDLILEMNKKRHIPDRGFTEEIKKQMLDLHNVYRGNVTPPAGNMNFLEWDEKLEHLSQLWADNCVFAHGRPPNTSYLYNGRIQPYGQNLYIGTDPSGYKGLWMWYEEYMHYGLRNRTCKPNEQCGHYVQMAWAESTRLGCGITLCGRRYLIVCHYYPGATRSMQMFKVGRPCSLCNIDVGTHCKDKLCVPNELCERKPKVCESATCNLKCQNCGLLNKTACQCTCADGWDTLDCSIPCEDEHERCGISPGFPHKGSCSLQSYSVAKRYCRKMCDTCATVTNDERTDHHLCCEGRLCEKGYVLDLERKPCRCTLLCPGPQCDFVDDTSSALKYNFILLISQIFALFINHVDLPF